MSSRSLSAGWIDPQQAVRIGPYRIRIVAGDGGPPSDLDLPRLTLDLSHRGFKTSECQIDGGLALVGSSTDCQVRLLDPEVSSTHCSLLSTAMGVWVVDLFGEGGIRLNGVPVRHAMLSEGDELQVGCSSIRIRHVHAVESDPSQPPAELSWSETPSHEPAVLEVASPVSIYGTHDAPGPGEEPGAVSSWASPDPVPTCEM